MTDSDPSSQPGAVALIAAVARNGTIGKNGSLPWHLPADLQHFKSLTSGKRIIMGRRTWESFLKPLPNREHVVISSQALQLPAGVLLAASMEEALALPGATDVVFIIGGNRAYADALRHAHDIYLTEIEADVAGDASFPAWPRERFEEISRQSHVADDVPGIGRAVRYSFVHYQRKPDAKA